MSEKEETQEIQEQTSGKPTEETATLYEKTERVVKELKVENNRREELLIKEEEARAKAMLGGRSEGGVIVEKKEETAEEYSKRVMSGDFNG